MQIVDNIPNSCGAKRRASSFIHRVSPLAFCPAVKTPSKTEIRNPCFFSRVFRIFETSFLIALKNYCLYCNS
jgi:hypothetical protein